MEREAVRVVLLDGNDDLVLVRFWDGARSWWCLPGGGVEPGEDDEDAARREMREELGLDAFELGPCIWTRRHAGTFRGIPFDQTERIYLGRTHHFTPTSMRSDAEHAEDDIRWWSLDELVTSEETFSPRGLPRSFGALLAEGPPAQPRDVGV